MNFQAPRLRNDRTRWRQILLLALCCRLGPGFSQGADLPAKMVQVFTVENKGVTHFYVQNSVAADVTATLELNLVNLKCSTNLPYTATFPGNRTVEAFTVCPIEETAPWSCSFTNSFTIGSLGARHDDSHVYTLPYAAGAEYRVSQGYHGAYSHTGPDEYSIDWKMPRRTRVHAARDGVVVVSKDDSNVGGRKRKFENSANSILIRHSDGTIGIYAHLLKGGNRVKVGDKVNVGDWIALSGNTGFTSGSHLHFSVFKAKNGREHESIPIKFQTANAPALTLVTGKSYRCVPVTTQQVRLSRPPDVATETRKKS